MIYALKPTIIIDISLRLALRLLPKTNIAVVDSSGQTRVCPTRVTAVHYTTCNRNIHTHIRINAKLNNKYNSTETRRRVNVSQTRNGTNHRETLPSLREANNKWVTNGRIAYIRFSESVTICTTLILTHT